MQEITMKDVLMVLPHMVGGGAERVASLLVNSFQDNHIRASVVLTSDKSEDVVRCDLKEDIPLILLQESMKSESVGEKIKFLPAKIISKILCRIYEKLGKTVPSYLAYLSMIWQYHREIHAIREMMCEKPEMTVVVFLQPAIPIVLLAVRDLPNKVIISERCDPNRLMKKRYGKAFIEKYYERANAAVFQTEEAKAVYPANVSKKGCVIFNPLKDKLPEPFQGCRNHVITTFCRISEQKNLPILLEAFYLLHKDYPEYQLKIIGDAPNEEGKRVVDDIKKRIEELDLEGKVSLLPFSKNVHEEILEDAMYVNSSDYEGISNAMLEAMAIGMPVVCTDCPIGGAHATIQHEVNGMLVPVRDAQAMYLAMKKIIEDEELARRISSNAAKLRETLSLENIAKQWMELL